jgi:hypothetical protein
MAYYPSRADSPILETAKTAATLFGNATPGYGTYTFVLLGAGFDPKSRPDAVRYAELLRVIETYVLSAERGASGPSPDAHAFLVAVQPDRGAAPLVEQTGPKLSEPMRADLAGYLGQQGQSALAERLTDRPGPFLISSQEPRLVPIGGGAPRLIVDLSNIGTENMYAVVDAYDQPVPTALGGRSDGLSPIRRRLLGLFGGRVPEEDPDPALKDAWVFRLGAAVPGDVAGTPNVVDPGIGSGASTLAPGAASGTGTASGAGPQSARSAPSGTGWSGTVPQQTMPTTTIETGPRPAAQPQTK